VLERIELTPPEAAVLRDPVAGRLERVGRQPAAALPSHLAIGDEARAPEHTEVLEERRQRHPVGPGELPHRRLTLPEAREDGPPDGIGEGAERVVKCRLIVNHLV
jgi:hypothetical protein